MILFFAITTMFLLWAGLVCFDTLKEMRDDIQWRQ